ncbi:LOW QUALITY PROTEIN: urocortin-3-like [Bombina bombina]|uniref:LOW QUALITY PROTEIN: urocortin-3-like n=1 Tax=Bombina bombina TaxID=8345 RepID=UPI00235B0756|nr:LOW QUALITY PROTEIN: urocortin-3-like [Bombina bombina]
MPHTRLLLLLLLLCMARSSLHYKLYKAESIFSCLKEVLEEAKRRSLEVNSVLSKRGYDYGPTDDLLSQEEEDEDEKEKKDFPCARYRYLSQAQVKGKVYQNKAKSDRRTKFTLSLDVPTNLMNILFDIAKAKNMRAKAAANAQLMAQIGRRK